MNNVERLPIGQRVTHFDGGPSTHGKGTIVDYNGKTKLSDEQAQKMVESGHPLMVNVVASKLYSGDRCPYVVHWDPSPRYPDGYKDVYESDSVRPIIEEPKNGNH